MNMAGLKKKLEEVLFSHLFLFKFNTVVPENL